MADSLWELQNMINDNNTRTIKLITSQLNDLINIIADHENAMNKMINQINKLNEQVSKLEGSR